VADLDEAFGQDVLEEAAMNSVGGNGCGLVAACAKDDCVIIRVISRPLLMATRWV